MNEGSTTLVRWKQYIFICSINRQKLLSQYNQTIKILKNDRYILLFTLLIYWILSYNLYYIKKYKRKKEMSDTKDKK